MKSPPDATYRKISLRVFSDKVETAGSGRTKVEGGRLPGRVAQQSSGCQHQTKRPEVQVQAVVGGDRKEGGILADQIRKVPREASSDGRICEHILQNQVGHSEPVKVA